MRGSLNALVVSIAIYTLGSATALAQGGGRFAGESPTRAGRRWPMPWCGSTRPRCAR